MSSPNPYAPDPTAPRIAEWFGEACRLFAREWPTWCMQGLLYTLLPAVPIGLGIGVAAGGIAGAMATPPTPGRPEPVAGAIPFAIIAFTVGTVLALALAGYLLAGMLHSAARQLRGERIVTGDIFRVGDAGTLLRVFGVSLALTAALLVGTLLCVVPALFVGGLLLLAHPLVVERGMGVGEALRESVRITRRHLGGYTLWALLAYLVQGAGVLVACGTVATSPLMALMVMVAYRDATSEHPPAPTLASSPNRVPGNKE